MLGLLVRHGHTDAVGRWLSNESESLNKAGQQEAEQLRRAFTWTPVTAVYSSPLKRAIETADPLASDHGLRVRIRPSLTDLDYGDWTGRRLDELEPDPAWRRFNQDRAQACAPHGESLPSVAQRIQHELLQLQTIHAGEIIVVVTHAEPIRCLVAAFTGRTLNDVSSVSIEPAHVTIVGLKPHLHCVLEINATPDYAAG